MTVPPFDPPTGGGDIPQPPQPPPPPPPMPPMPPMGGGQMNGGQQKNDTALYAMIAGLVGFFCLGIFAAIPAIILGIQGKKKAAMMGGEGEGQAKAGLILGWITVVLNVIGIIIWVCILIFASTTTSHRSSSNSGNGSGSSGSSSSYYSYGDTIDTADYSIVDDNTDIDTDGTVTYSGYIHNYTGEEQSFELSVYCSGSEGDADTTSAYASSVSDDDEGYFSATFYFDRDTSYADCNVDDAYAN